MTGTACSDAAIRNGETDIRTTKLNHPGKSRPQQNLWSFDLLLVCLLLLTVTFFVLTLYSILQANLALLHIEPSLLLSLKILDTSSAASLFVTLLGALLVRHQFALSVLPRINYKAVKMVRQHAQNPNNSCETWRVEIRNTGLGPAIVNRAEYVLDYTGAKGGPQHHTFEGFIKALARLQLTRDSDYWIEKISEGFSLSPKDDCFVFEIKTAHLAKLTSLYMELDFQGQLGDKYRREIFLIPKA